MCVAVFLTALPGEWPPLEAKGRVSRVARPLYPPQKGREASLFASSVLLWKTAPPRVQSPDGRHTCLPRPPPRSPSRRSRGRCGTTGPQAHPPPGPGCSLEERPLLEVPWELLATGAPWALPPGALPLLRPRWPARLCVSSRDQQTRARVWSARGRSFVPSPSGPGPGDPRRQHTASWSATQTGDPHSGDAGPGLCPPPPALASALPPSEFPPLSPLGNKNLSSEAQAPCKQIRDKRS